MEAGNQEEVFQGRGAKGPEEAHWQQDLEGRESREDLSKDGFKRIEGKIKEDLVTRGFQCGCQREEWNH